MLAYITYQIHAQKSTQLTVDTISPSTYARNHINLCKKVHEALYRKNKKNGTHQVLPNIIYGTNSQRR